jgi:restriction endonuclease S subunit
MEVLSSAVVGVTIPNIRLRTLREVPVPVPPLEEQEEIVATYQAKLDEVRILKLRAQRALDEVRSLFDREE